MDDNQRDFFYRMPYPMMYPYPNLYMTEVEADKDLEYLQQLYPIDAKKMQRFVEEECEKLEYEGSMMYDEYPDRLSTHLIAERIAKRLKSGDGDMEGTGIDPDKRNLLEVLLYNEMHKRRCRRRRCRRFW